VDAVSWSTGRVVHSTTLRYVSERFDSVRVWRGDAASLLTAKCAEPGECFLAVSATVKFQVGDVGGGRSTEDAVPGWVAPSSCAAELEYFPGGVPGAEGGFGGVKLPPAVITVVYFALVRSRLNGYCQIVPYHAVTPNVNAPMIVATQSLVERRLASLGVRFRRHSNRKQYDPVPRLGAMRPLRAGVAHLGYRGSRDVSPGGLRPRGGAGGGELERQRGVHASGAATDPHLHRRGSHRGRRRRRR